MDKKPKYTIFAEEICKEIVDKLDDTCYGMEEYCPMHTFSKFDKIEIKTIVDRVLKDYKLI